MCKYREVCVERKRRGTYCCTTIYILLLLLYGMYSRMSSAPAAAAAAALLHYTSAPIPPLLTPHIARPSTHSLTHSVTLTSCTAFANASSVFAVDPFPILVTTALQNVPETPRLDLEADHEGAKVPKSLGVGHPGRGCTLQT